METQEVLNLLFEKMRWVNGPTEREVNLLTTMDYFSQNILVSGARGTGKSTTICTGLAAYYLSLHGLGGNGDDPAGNGGDDNAGEDGGEEDMSIDSIPTNPTNVNEEDKTEVIDGQENEDILENDAGMTGVADGTNTENDAGMIGVADGTNKENDAGMTGVADGTNKENDAGITGVIDDTNKENDAGMTGVADGTNKENDAGITGVIDDTNKENDVNMGNKKEVGEDFNVNNMPSIKNENDVEMKPTSSTSTTETSDNGVDRMDGRVEGKAFAFIICYKTQTCLQTTEVIQYLIPQARVLPLTGTVNWATNFKDICRADVLLITYDHLQYFYRTAWPMVLPDLKYFVVDEAVCMSHVEDILAIDFFLDNYVDRRVIQIIIISRIISNTDTAMYRRLVGQFYTRCDMNRQVVFNQPNNRHIPNIIGGQFNG